MRTLILGCGNIPGASKPGNEVVNHDRAKHRPEIDVAHDLNQMPWPWPDHSFDRLTALSVLEHLDRDLLASMNECHRLLVAGGLLTIKLPMWNAERSYDDPTHRWFFTLHSLDQLCPETQRGQEYSFYTPHKWRFVDKPVANEGGTSLWATLQTL